MIKNKDVHFEHNFLTLLIWFFGTYFIFGPLLKFLRTFSISIDHFEDSQVLMLLPVLSSMLGFFLFMLMSYLAFYYFYRKSTLALIAGIALAFIIPIAVRFFIEQRLFLWLFDFTNYNEGTTFSYYYVDNTYFAVYYLPAGILYYFFRRNQALQKLTLEAEKARSLAELQYLRSQVNPHFLFNSLNNIYSLAFEKSEKILPAIEGLSELLRYALYEKAKMVPFHKEWEKIEKYILLEEMRLDSPTNISINISDDVQDLEIPPLLILPLIENVFKHGDLTSAESQTVMKAFRDDGEFVFKIVNPVGQQMQKDKTSGIGLENIKKRLAHRYSDKAQLVISDDKERFSATVRIPLN